MIATNDGLVLWCIRQSRVWSLPIWTHYIVTQWSLCEWRYALIQTPGHTNVYYMLAHVRERFCNCEHSTTQHISGFSKICLSVSMCSYMYKCICPCIYVHAYVCIYVWIEMCFCVCDTCISGIKHTKTKSIAFWEVNTFSLSGKRKY